MADSADEQQPILAAVLNMADNSQPNPQRKLTYA